MIHTRQLFNSHQSTRNLLRAPLGFERRLAAPVAPLLDEQRRDYRLDEAYGYCENLARTRFENVPVASRFVSEEKRPHVLSVYAFARAADDFADQPSYEGRRQTALDAWESELYRTFHGEADHPIFVALRDTVERCDLPITPFSDLLTAFRMDLSAQSYATFDQLRTYCRMSSESLGQLVLLIFGYREPRLHGYAGDLCTGLQLAMFLQDLSLDLPRGRSYLPAEDLRHFGLDEETLQSLRTASASGGRYPTTAVRAFRDLVRFQVSRARSLLERGRPLIDAVGADLSMELQLTYLSGQAMLDKIEGLLEEILRTRPTLSRSDRARVLARTLGRRVPSLLTGELGILGSISAVTGPLRSRSGRWPGWIDR